MGLFDIFRHKKKSAAASPASQANSQSQTTSPASADTKVKSNTIAPAPNEAANMSSASEGTATVSSSSQASNVGNGSAEKDQTDHPVRTQKAYSDVSTDSLDNENSESEAAASPASDASETMMAVSDAKSAPVAHEQKAIHDQASSQNDEESSQPASENKPAEKSTETAEERYDRGLEKSRTGFGARLNRFLANFRHVDEDFFDNLEDLMIESDVGYDMAMKLSDSLQEEVKLRNAKSKQEVSNVIIEKMVSLYEKAGNGENNQINYAKNGPTVIMFVGVNGAGKTTTIGKLAARYKRQGKKVLLAAADTFRAGAVEQLDVWAKRDGVDIVTGPENGDPAAVVFDGVKKAKKEKYDFLLVDTAGRLQNKVNLMNELAKMKRIMSREIPEAPHEVLLVLDATTGQNALNQAKLFKESTDVSGIVLTKLDGTARGGIVLAIRNELHLPVKLVGLGEHVDDLADFDASEFIYGLFKGLVNE